MQQGKKISGHNNKFDSMSNSLMPNSKQLYYKGLELFKG